MVEYFKSIKLPFSDFNKLAIGAVLYIIPVVNLITGIFATGYILEAAKNAMNKKFTMPKWKGWGKLFVKGLLAVIITLIYFIPAMILLFIGLGSRITIFMPVMIVIGAIVGIVTFYFSPNAIMQFIHYNRFSAAFRFKDVIKRGLTGRYLIAWIIAVIYTVLIILIGSGISSLLSFTIILPFIITGFIQFIASITMLTIIAQAYAEIGIPKKIKKKR